MNVIYKCVLSFVRVMNKRDLYVCGLYVHVCGLCVYALSCVFYLLLCSYAIVIELALHFHHSFSSMHLFFLS